MLSPRKSHALDEVTTPTRPSLSTNVKCLTSFRDRLLRTLKSIGIQKVVVDIDIGMYRRDADRYLGPTS